MKTHPTKADKRNALNQEVERFLSQGGSINSVEQGVSGRENPTSALLPNLFCDSKQKTRTDAREALLAMDSRKSKKAPPAPRRKHKKIPVYDDFGELLRWVWPDKE